MNKELIRKNIITNQWEHYFPSDNTWCQGLIGNEQYKYTNYPNQLQKYNENILLSYDSVLYENEQSQLKLFTSSSIQLPFTSNIVDVVEDTNNNGNPTS